MESPASTLVAIVGFPRGRISMDYSQLATLSGSAWHRCNAVHRSHDGSETTNNRSIFQNGASGGHVEVAHRIFRMDEHPVAPIRLHMLRRALLLRSCWLTIFCSQAPKVPDRRCTSDSCPHTKRHCVRLL